MKFKLFISSVQSEFAEERARLVDYIRKDALLGIFFEPFIFEEIQACDSTPQGVYLNEVKDCDVYIGLLGRRFGFELDSGMSATESEYELATKLQKTRLVFLKEPGGNGSARGIDELPELAVREAIVNAVCHRDYSDNGSVQVMLFRNRLEIINPGTLPKGWTVERLLRTHDSKARNLVLAQALNWAGYVEKSGNGTEAIVRRCVQSGLKTPEYHPDNADFKVIIWRRAQSGHSQGTVRESLCRHRNDVLSYWLEGNCVERRLQPHWDSQISRGTSIAYYESLCLIV